MSVYFDGHVFVTIIGRYVIKNAFPADPKKGAKSMGDDADTPKDSHSSLRKDTKVKSFPSQTRNEGSQ